jgi:hypothetical protein
MGFFDQIGDIFDMAVDPIVATVFGGPSAGAASLGTTAQRNKVYERSDNQMDFYQGMNEGQMSPAQFGTPTSRVNNRGFFSDLGQTIGSFGRDVGGFIGDIAPALNLLGVGNGFARTNAGTAITIDTGRPQETSQSGEILGANLGLAGNIIGAASRFARSPGGSTALGFGAGALGAAFGGGSSGAPRITRKMKSDVRRIYMMAGMDPNMTAQILNNMGTYPRMDFNASLVFFILTKRFRNDGPVVTKAAVRKTKTTLRRMKGVVDMYNSVCKPTARRAPTRRAAPKAVQLIKN